MSFKIQIINGPNLNLLGTRDPEIYGSKSLSDIISEVEIEAKKFDCEISHFQSNIEGELVNAIQGSIGKVDGIVINPAAYTHTSVAIRDALDCFTGPIVEVHLSNIHKREEFRHKSLVSEVATGAIIGLGAKGYTLALHALVDILKNK